MKEVWKIVEWYENYEVSNTGRVRSLNYCRTGVVKELSTKKNSRGYHSVSLHKNGKSKDITVHRLVAMAFIPNPRNCKEVNHIDGNIKNNNVSNLEWCTREENLKHESEVLKKGHKRAIIAIYPNGEIKEFESTAEASRITGVSKPTIWKNLHHWFKNEKGFVFKYKDEVKILLNVLKQENQF